MSTRATAPGGPPTLVARLRRAGPELAKFVVVGGLCFVLDFALANAFRYGIGLGPTTSKALSTIIATAASYAGNRLWSFAHRIDSDNPTHGRDIVVFSLINAAGLVITLIPVDVVHYGFGRDSALAFNVSQVAGTAIATVFRFWAYRRWVFAAPPEVVASGGGGPDGAPDDAALDRAV